MSTEFWINIVIYAVSIGSLAGYAKTFSIELSANGGQLFFGMNF